jgi:hypothetical protein
MPIQSQNAMKRDRAHTKASMLRSLLWFGQIAVLSIGAITACSDTLINSSQSNTPAKLVEQPNPVDKDDAINRALFSDLYKQGIAKTSKEMMDEGRKDRESGDLPVGSGISPGFFANNTGGMLKGLRLTVSGSAVDQGMLAKPQIIINSDSSEPWAVAFLKSKELYREALKKAQYVGEPVVQTVNGTVVWSVDAPDFELDTGGQLRVAMNCDVVKPGSAGFVFSVYPLNSPGQALIRHVEKVSVREPIGGYELGKTKGQIQ